MILMIAIVAFAILSDQVTKLLAVTYLKGQPSVPVLGDLLHFSYTENTGAAFGMMKDSRWVFMVFSCVAIVALIAFAILYHPQSRLERTAIAMLIGGGIGNMIDRFVLGYVVDFLYVKIIDFAVFNVADSFVCVGAGLLILYFLLDWRREANLKKSGQTAKEDGKNE